MNLRHALTRAILLGLLLAPALVPTTEARELSPRQPGLRLLENDLQGLSLRCGFEDLSAFDVDTPAGTFSELRLDGLGATATVGAPKLPVWRKIVRVPLGAELRLSVRSSSSSDLPLTELGADRPLLPAQASLSKSQDPATAPFVVDADACARSTFAARPAARVVDLGVLRGQRLALVELEPVQIDPARGVARVHNDVELRLDYDGADWGATEELRARTRSPFFEGVYSATALNADPLPDRDAITEYPVKYVIVTASMFTDQLASFIEWKTRKGFEVIVGEVGSPELGSTTASIKSWLQGLYEAATPESPAPSFILYVGDDNLVPTWQGGAGSHVTDLDYALYTGGDHLPEVYYGRFSARSAAQLQPQIDKTLEYERYEMPDPSYLGEAVMIAGVDGTYAPTHGNGQINYGTQQYFNAAHGIESHTYLYPLSDDPSASSWVRADVSAGAGYVNYTAHGSQTSWADPSFTVPNVEALTNAHKYGTVVGNCCLTNSFQVETCFGESWLRAQDKGSIGYIGGSNNTYWDEDYWWGVGNGPIVASGATYEQTGLGAYDGAFHDHGEPVADWFTTQGGLLVRGNLAVTESGSSLTTYYWEIYHLMGDPSLSTWMNVPTANAVVLPAAIFLGQGTATVQAEPYSYVGLSLDGELRASGLVGASGSLVLEFEPFTMAGDADVVVTHHQKQPFVSTIALVPNDGAYVTLNDFSPATAVYGQSVAVDLTLENIGTVGATGVAATASCGNAFVALSDGAESFGSIAAGATAVRGGALAFDLLAGVADQTNLAFDLAIAGTEAREVWPAAFTIVAQAPVWTVGAFVVDDAAGGDGNGRLDPGETAQLRVSLANDGHAASPAVATLLETASPWITLTVANQAFGPVAPGGTVEAVFELSVDGGAPVGEPVDFAFSADAGAYDAAAAFGLAIGLVLEDFESGGFLAFAWEQGGTAPWTVDGSAVHGGAWSAKSGTITHNQSSVLSLSADVLSPGELSFWYKVSSEATYDFLTFSVDGSEVGSWSGEVDWTLFSTTVGAGAHVFSWTYDKDVSVNDGGDCAWIDDIVFPAIGLPPQPVLAVSPEFLEVWLAPGETGQESIALGNQGEGELLWTASVQTVGERLASIPAMKLGKDEADPRVGQASRDAGGPDGFGYAWSDSGEPGGPVYDWVEISGIGTPGTYGDDSSVGPFSLGFGFPFYGTVFPDVRVCSNGFLSFTSTATAYSNQGIPTAAEPNNLVAPFWEDLNPSSGGQIYTWADAANQRFVVQWTAVPRYSNSSALETFQAILHADGRILFQYHTVSDATSVTVGIENADGSDGLEVVANAAYLADGLAVELSFETPWISISPLAGAVAPGGTANIVVDLDASELLEGDHEALVTIASNDPDRPQAMVPVRLHVGQPQLDAPVVTITSPNACATQISWTAVPGATGYRVWSKDSLADAWTLEHETTYTFYDLLCIVPGNKRVYCVTAVR